MYQLIVKPHALAAAMDAYEWYEKQRDGLGDFFLTQVDVCFKKLQLNPTAASKIDKNYRQARVMSFPYVIVYEVIKMNIIIYSIFHTSRNPKEKYRK